MTSAPLKLGEAFSVGIPVVASDIPALTDIDARHAVHPVTPDDPSALADGIAEVLKDPDYGTRLVERGYVVAERWDVRERARRILSLASELDPPEPNEVYGVLSQGWLHAGPKV